MLDRRRFIAGGAAALAAVAQPEIARAVQQALRAPEPDGGSPDGGSPDGGPAWTPDRSLLRTLPRWLELSAVPGVALAVVEGGRTWQRGFGRASVERRVGVADDTVFEGASLGKPVFAHAVLRLADAGVLDLDRPLYDYLPVEEAADRRMRRVTARHVLGHTTGLPNWRREPGPLVPASDPGSTFSYSGEGFFFLQRVVERVTDTPIARLMHERVFAPLGMRDTSYVWRADFEARMATGYDEKGEGLDTYAAIGRRAEEIARSWKKPLAEWRYDDAVRAAPLIQPAWPVLPVFLTPNVAASLLTTARDYARFLAQLVAPADGVAGAATGGPLALAPATRRALLTPQVRLNSALAWGLGWGLEEDEQGRALWQWGANLSFRAFALAEPDHGRAVVVLTNSLNGPKLYQRVVTAVTGHDHAAFLWPFL
ncbi:MAG TPA: serine hydrolase domain-containing protein [Gemmatimonadales bacterium]|nr:serine hydrolase domain-containing protein [Gemmatimonadales bacterium]